MRFQCLDDWLNWQAGLHPSAIELGLDRVSAVWERLHAGAFPSTVITVAGTNGKGSCVALLEAILRAAGYRVGCYTSPHLLRYNERIRVDGRQADDETLCRAFERVDCARGEKLLTFFEFGTLAALDIFVRERPDVVILEVGLGGRLDAVNIVDPDVALITSVDLDHTQWLGSDVEQIALEKAGILRSGRPAVFGGRVPAASLLRYAEEFRVPLAVAGRDYCFEEKGERWAWCCGERRLSDLPKPSLAGRVQVQNGAAVLKVLDALPERFRVDPNAVSSGLAKAALAGRFQVIPGSVPVVLDVAHNPAAVLELKGSLDHMPCRGRTLALFAVLSDKDAGAMAKILAPGVDGWFVAGLESDRALLPEETADRIRRVAPGSEISLSDSVEQAYTLAHGEARPGDRLVVFGSFLTVAAVLELL